MESKVEIQLDVPEDNRDKSFMLWLSEDEHARLLNLSKQLEMTMSDILRMSIRGIETNYMVKDLREKDVTEIETTTQI